MAGMPQRRARRLSELIEDGVVPALPDDWHARSTVERLEANLGLSIDKCHQILSLPLAGATPGQLSAIKEIALAHVNAGFRRMFTNQAADKARANALVELSNALALRAADSRAGAPDQAVDTEEIRQWSQDTSGTPKS